MRHQTILQILNQLPEPYRSQAIAEANRQGRQKQLNETSLYGTKESALACAFYWQTSPQGLAYWQKAAQTTQNITLKLNL